MNLRQYQIDGIEKLRSFKDGGVLGDDPGLGKTIQAANATKNEYTVKVLIVGPLASKNVWVGANSDVYTQLGYLVEEYPAGDIIEEDHYGRSVRLGWFFINYHQLHKNLSEILMWQPQALIVDEVHLAKNKKTSWAKALIAISRLKSVKRRICLSASVIVNRPADLWMPLTIAQPRSWPNFHDFCLRYADGKYTGFGWDYSGISNEDELKEKLKGVYIRRTRSEVANELPASTEQKLIVDLDGLYVERYNAAYKNIVKFLSLETDKGKHLAQLTTLMNIVSLGKVKATVEQVEAVGEQKTVVFCWFKETAAKLEKELKRRGYEVFVVTGDDGSDRRKLIATWFAGSSEKSVFIGTYKAAGVSINDLICARVAIMHDISWTPSDLVQAKGRLDRQGQRKNTLFYYMICKNTVDEHVINKVIEKINYATSLGTYEPNKIRLKIEEEITREIINNIKEYYAKTLF